MLMVMMVDQNKVGFFFKMAYFFVFFERERERGRDVFFDQAMCYSQLEKIKTVNQN